ncbi:sodium/hydrogen exchanger 9-like isoform X1 [Salarias fasciatus]|uniref:sodium/hydrogen exchanger 9-like isoform X1 n=1 Tax=Salarias fasciatus TaxID=181472 RepID=UPI001176B866|nr:sodium/hydrogen exchanger 9-like isoform X1 [Salarias fasciatus]
MSGLSPDKAAVLPLAALALALITILSVWKLKQFRFKLMNETGGAMLYGMLLGFAVRCLHSGEHMGNIESECMCQTRNSTPHILIVNTTSHGHCYRHVGKINQSCPLISTPHTFGLLQETFDPEVLFNLFLPPIIFYGAYTLNQKRFFENLGSILTYAFVGTIISCAIIGASAYGATRLMVLLGQAADGEAFSLTDCLLFGAIISATDPVSLLGLLSELHVDLDLYSLLFGESVLNDAVAVVLTHAIVTYQQTGAGHVFDHIAFFRSVGLFLGVLVASVLLGFIFAVITALLTKFTRLWENPLLETSVFVLLSWSSFLSADACGLSGIVAVLFCALSQSRYTAVNLSSEGRTRIMQLFEVFNFLGEIFIFGYMGYVLLTFPHHAFKALFIFGAFISIFISRACNIYPLSFLLNLGRTRKIPAACQHFMMIAGLRGAVAFSLAVRDTSTDKRKTIFTTSLLVVAFTVWVLGMTAGPALRRLDIRVGADEDENPQDLSVEVDTGRPDTTPGLWHHLDCKYLKPALTHAAPPLSGSLPPCCGVFSRVFSGPQIQEDQEQLCETQPDKNNPDLEKTEEQIAATGGDSGSDHHEDLLEGDLGLGTAPASVRQA